MNKQTTIRAVARKTGHTYFEAQTMLEALIDVWGEALAEGDHIAIQNFLTIKVAEIKTHRRGKLRNHKPNTAMWAKAHRIDARASHLLKKRLDKLNYK